MSERREQPRARSIGGIAVVDWVDADGCVRSARDQCPHRRARLSAGTVEDGVLRCAYHGWRFGSDGQCLEIPAIGPDGHVPPRAQLDMLDGCAAIATPVTSSSWLDGDHPGLANFWHPVCRLAEAPVGAPTPIELLGDEWTVTVGVDGSVDAVSRTGAAAWGATTHLDHVWISPQPARNRLPDVPEWGQPEWHLRRLSRAEGRYGVGLLLDNQLDAGHFAFVHASTFGSPRSAVLPGAEIERADGIVTSTMRIPIAARHDVSALRGDRQIDQHRTMRYAFHAPLWLRLQLDYDDTGGSTILLFGFVPLGAGRARMDVDILFFDPAGFTEEQLDERLAFEERVVGEDLALQQQFDDLRLPLDLSAELHTKADRYSVVCRNLIRTLLEEVDAKA